MYAYECSDVNPRIKKYSKSLFDMHDKGSVWMKPTGTPKLVASILPRPLTHEEAEPTNGTCPF